MAGAEDLMLPVQRVEMNTDDLDVSATIGHLNAGLVRMVGLEYQAQADPVDWLLTVAVSAGTVGATAGREQAIVARGGALLFPLGAQFTVTGRSAAAVALRIPLGAAADLAEENTGLPAADLRFESMGPVSAADPAAGTTVAAIARRWGFSRPDRFAAAYRTAYGRPLRHTLRR